MKTRKIVVSSMLAIALMTSAVASASAAVTSKGPISAPVINKHPIQPGGGSGASIYPSDKNCWIPAKDRIYGKEVKLDNAPQEVRDWVSGKKETGGKGSLTAGDRTYILAALGQKPTGGYSVTFGDVYRKGSKIIATVRESKPSGTAMVPQMVTYPFVLISIEKTDLTIEFAGGQQAKPIPLPRPKMPPQTVPPVKMPQPKAPTTKPVPLPQPNLFPTGR